MEQIFKLLKRTFNVFLQCSIKNCLAYLSLIYSLKFFRFCFLKTTPMKQHFWLRIVLL